MTEKNRNSIRWYHIVLIIIAVVNLYWMVTMERLYSTIDKIQSDVKETRRDVNNIQVDLSAVKTKVSYIETEVKNQKGKP